MTNAILDRAEFVEATLTRANLSGVRLRNTSFYSAELESVNLTGAELVGVNLVQANLENTVWDGAQIDPTTQVAGAIFTHAKGLTTEQKVWLKQQRALNVPH